MLQYEKISSPFFLFKNYLDIIGRVIFNHCDKYLLPALLIKNRTTCCGKWKMFSADSVFSEKKKLEEVVYLSAIKLIRRLVISLCQTTNSYSFIEWFNTYLPNIHYKNPYLSIDHPPPSQKKKKMNTFCISLRDALSKKFTIDVVTFVSKKKKHIHLSLDKPLFEYRNYESILTFIRKYF